MCPALVSHRTSACKLAPGFVFLYWPGRTHCSSVFRQPHSCSSVSYRVSSHPPPNSLSQKLSLGVEESSPIIVSGHSHGGAHKAGQGRRTLFAGFIRYLRGACFSVITNHQNGLPPLRCMHTSTDCLSSALQVEHCLFRVLSSGFRKSQVFVDMFSLPVQERGGQEGTSDAAPIKLDGIKADDFRALLDVLYPPTGV